MPFELLLDYQEGRTASTETARIREHLAAGCTECTRELQWMGKTTRTLRDAGNVVVPASLLERSRALFRERFPAPQRSSWLPQLIFDSRQQVAMAGVRGAGSASFQLIYRTDAFDIELWQDPLENEQWYVIGQVLSQQSDAEIVPVSVVLKSADNFAMTLTPNASEFHLPMVPAGTYQLTLGLPEGDLEISDLRIG